MLVPHQRSSDELLVAAGKAGASQKTMEKVKSDKDAGLREGMLSLSSKLGAAGKKAGSAAEGKKDCSHTCPLHGKHCQAIRVTSW